MASLDILADLLFQASGRSGPELDRFLAEAEAEHPEVHGELVRLLRHPLLGPTREFAVGAAQATFSSLAPHADRGQELRTGDRLGPYEIEALIGSGGMGRVYRARQLEPIARTVALKQILPGMDSVAVLRRFRNERRTLAALEHPNLARALDAGTDASGRPYLVMDLVDGPSITEHAREHHLSVDDRVRLLRQACLGTAHAHAKGVVHRDLKSSNILVADTGEAPAARVIDFGMATLLGSPDDGGSFECSGPELRRFPVGTLRTMSPEQLAGEPVDERTDVHALGGVLYELLSGRTPFDEDLKGPWSFEALARARRNISLVPPSSVTGTRTSTASRGRELDWICLRALEGDPARRYQTVTELVEDLDRFLEHRSVQAVPPSRTYRLRKFVRRHRTAATIGATIACAILATNVVVTVAYFRVVDAKEEAEAALVDSEASAEFLSSVLSAASPFDMGPEASLRSMVERSLGRVDSELADSERVRAKIRPLLGSLLISLGSFEEAGNAFESAHAEIQNVYGRDSVEMAHLLVRTAALKARLGERNASRESAREAEQLLRRLPDAPVGLLILARHLAARALVESGDGLPDGLVEAEATLAFAESQGLAHHPLTGLVEVSVASAERSIGKLREAERRMTRVLADFDRGAYAIDGVEKPWELEAGAREQLGVILITRGAFDEACSELRRAVELASKGYGPDALPTLDYRAHHALARSRGGDPKQAALELQSVIDKLESAGRGRTGSVLTHRSNLLGLAVATRDYDVILSRGPGLLDDLREVCGPDSTRTAQAHALLGRALASTGDRSQGIEHWTRAADIYEQRGATGQRIYRSILLDLGRALVKEERFDEARAVKEKLQ